MLWPDAGSHADLTLFYLLHLARRTLGSALGPYGSYAIIRENFLNLHVKVARPENFS